MAAQVLVPYKFKDSARRAIDLVRSMKANGKGKVAVAIIRRTSKNNCTYAIIEEKDDE